MGTIKKRHHFVSAFYLEGFIDQGHPPFLCLYDKEERSVKDVSAKDAGCRKLFYAFPTKDGGMDTNTLEDIFQKLESQVAPLLDKIESRQALTNEERSVLSRFLALSLTRVPNFRMNIADAFQAHVIKQVAMRMAHHTGFEEVRQSLTEKGEPIDEEAHTELVEMMKEGRFNVKMAPHSNIEIFLNLAEDLAPIIHRMEWTYLIPNERYSLVTSDNPVAYADPTHSLSSPYGVGLEHRNVELTFPIMQHLALFAKWGPSGPPYRKVSDAAVRVVNMRTIRSAERFVYASFNDPGFADLVWKYSNSSPKAQIATVPGGYSIMKGMGMVDSVSLSRLVGIG